MAELAAVVVGAGFSGLCAGIALKRAGIDGFVIVEKADRLGGTWRENTYPGAACDIPSHLYSYSFEPNPSWSRSYGGQPEILAYLERCADKYGLRAHLRFGAAVTEARFDQRTGLWTVRTPRETYTTRALVLGNGALHLPALPALPGIATFAGAKFHSARWDHACDLTGKRVAVIGTGASAIQFVPEIAPKVARLDVFQRTPPWILPKADRVMSEREQWVFDHVPGAHWLRRTGLYWGLESRVLGFVFAPKLNEMAEGLVLKHMHREIADPALRAKLTPNYRMGCKRVLLSNDYYRAVSRDNVSVLTERIAAIEPRGVRTADGVLHEADAMIFGTGFRATDYLAAIQIFGREGRDLNDVWRDGVRSYLGITVSGFPNLFLLMGPNTGLGHNSMIFMIEAQAHYAVRAIVELQRRGAAATMDVKPAVELAFKAALARKMKGTVWTSGCHSWYMAPDGEVLLWPGFTFDYWRRTRRVSPRDYAFS